MIAHRGRGTNYPENTAAGASAVASVADAVEIDVRHCGSDDLVALHDERLDRVTDETGYVNRQSCGILLNADVLGSGETVPKLREVLEVLPADVGLVVELKEHGLAADVLDQLKGYAHDVVLSSDRAAVLDEVRTRDRSVETAYVVRESPINRALRPLVPGIPSWLYAPQDTSETIRTAVELGCTAIHPRYELCLQTDLVSRARDASLLVEPWTITSLTEMKRLDSVGVDGLITDTCAEVARYLDGVGESGRVVGECPTCAERTRVS